VISALALLGKPAVAPASQSAITFENCYKSTSSARQGRWALPVFL